MAKFLGTKAKGATPRKATDGMSLFAAMLIGGVLTLAIGFFLYLWNPFNQGKNPPADTPEQAKAQTKANGDPTKPNYEFYDLLPEQKITGLPNQAIGDKAPITNPSITPDVVVNTKAKSGDTASSTANTVKTDGKKSKTGDTETVTTVTNPLNTGDSADNDNTEGEAAKPTGKASISAAVTDPSRRFILQINSFNNAEDADKRRAQVLIAGVDAQIVKKQLADGTLVYQVISHTMTSEQAVAEAQNRLQDNGIDSLIVEQRVAK